MQCLEAFDSGAIGATSTWISLCRQARQAPRVPRPFTKNPSRPPYRWAPGTRERFHLPATRVTTSAWPPILLSPDNMGFVRVSARVLGCQSIRSFHSQQGGFYGIRRYVYFPTWINFIASKACVHTIGMADGHAAQNQRRIRDLVFEHGFPGLFGPLNYRLVLIYNYISYIMLFVKITILIIIFGIAFSYLRN